jgi:predicted nucleic acid-binding protein
VLLDTDVLVDLIRGRPEALTWFAGLGTHPPAAGFAAMELVWGSQDAAELRRVRAFLTPFPLLWPSQADLLTAFSLAAVKLSHGLGSWDALIAATALGQGLPMATFNVRHFAGVPGLTTVQPYAR